MAKGLKADHWFATKGAPLSPYRRDKEESRAEIAVRPIRDSGGSSCGAPRERLLAAQIHLGINATSVSK